MQAITIVLFTALVVGFFVLFLLPDRWWPRRPRDDDDDDPPVSPGSTMSLN
jgi:hypothetical protein